MYMQEKNIRTLISDNTLDEGVIGKAITYPGRLIRSKRTKSVMSKYIKKIDKKISKLLNKLNVELPRKLYPIKTRAEVLMSNLEKNEKEHGVSSNEYQMAYKKLENFHKKYLDNSQSFINEQIKNLDSVIDKIINEYTKGIDDRIDKGGFILKTELSDQQKTDLKTVWIELIEELKNDLDTKKLDILQDKIIEEVDDLNAKVGMLLNKDQYNSNTLFKTWFGKSYKEPENLNVEIPSWP